MAQQKGSRAAVIIGAQADISTIATTGFRMPVNTCGVRPQQNINTAQTLTGTRNPVQPFRGNKDVSGDIVIPVDSRAMWHWMQKLFGDPTTAGGTAAAWQATNDYSVGDMVIPTTPNGRYYECTADSGSSGASEPTWPTTIGATVVDSGITWTCRAFVHEFKVADSQPFFTLETQFPDLTAPRYMQHLGCKAGSFGIDVGGDGELVATIGVLGADFAIATSPFDASPSTVSIARVSNFQAALTEAGAAFATARQLSINIDMDLDGDQFVIGGQGVRGDIPEGIVGVSGQATVLCNDAAFTLLTKGVNATESGLKLTITGSEVSVFELEIQELEFAVAGPTIETPRGLVVPVSYQGFYDNGSEGSVVVARLTNIDQHA